MRYYHVTAPENVADILANGFIPGWGDWGFGVYLFSDPAVAQDYARKGGWDGDLKGKSPVILEVETWRATSGEVHPSWDARKYETIRWIDMEDHQDEDDPRFMPDAVRPWSPPAPAAATRSARKSRA